MPLSNASENACRLDCCRRQVHAYDIEPLPGEIQRVLTGAAAGIDHAPADLTVAEQVDEHALRRADVPRHRAFDIRGLKAILDCTSIAFPVLHQTFITTLPTERAGPTITCYTSDTR
jgi:hypothetical protein